MSTSGSPLRKRGRRIALIVGLVVAGWLLVTVGLLAVTARDALDAVETIEDVGLLSAGGVSELMQSIEDDTDNVAEETAEEDLRAAAETFGNTVARLDSPLVIPLRFAPVLGRQLAAVGAMARSAETSATAGADAFGVLNSQLEGTAQTPAERLEAARTTEQTLLELREEVADIDLGPSEKLLPPVAEARNRFAEEHARTLDVLDTAVDAVVGITDFLEGPSRYLLLVANNAEMRAGSGMFLQIGTMDVEDGVFTVGDFLPAVELFSQEPAAQLDPDVAALWGWLAPDQEWRNLNLTPRFDETARMAADMWEFGGRGEIDGVIAVDPVGLQALLEIIGSVEVPGVAGTTTFSSDNVLEELFLGQYEDFVDDRDQRRDKLGRVASAVFEAFNSRSWSAAKLVRALDEAGRSRHFLAWSNVESQQEAWIAMGASGEMPDNALMVGLLNRGGNKLDQFLDIESELEVEEHPDGSLVTVRMVLSNNAPRTLPRYVEGPDFRTGLRQGEYLGILALTVPGGAGFPAVEGGDLVLSGDDGPNRVMASEVLVPQGEQRELTYSFVLPESWEELAIVPSSRVPAVDWSSGPNFWTDETQVDVAVEDLRGG